MTTPRQCDNEGNTAMATTKWQQTPQQCDDEGNTMMATMKR